MTQFIPLALRPALALALLASLSCSSSTKFGGTDRSALANHSAATPTVAPPAADAAPVAAPTPVPTPLCSDQSAGTDKIAVNWTGDAKACIDQGGTFNFELSQCAKTQKAAFDCDWKNVLEQVGKLGVSSDNLTVATTDGSKLVSCSQSADASRIVVQWVSAPPKSTSLCAYDPATIKVITGCYRLYPGDDVPHPASKAEQDQLVYDCMANN